MIHADIIISSNSIFTGLADKPEPASIAIRDNKIIGMGSMNEMLPLINENTEIYQFEDELVMPGFHDFHLHLMMAGLQLVSVDLASARSEEEAAKKVFEFAQENPDEEWIIGMQWDSSYWGPQQMPTRHSLDQVILDRPVFLLHAEGHFAWLNSKALEVLQINEFTPDPEFGSYEKVNGKLTGILYENAVTTASEKALNFSKEKKSRILERFMEEAAKYGITSVNDMFAPFDEVLRDYKLLEEMDLNDRLSVRIHLTPEIKEDITFAQKMGEELNSGKLKYSGLKGFLDGVITGYTALLLKPYEDKPGFCGEPAMPPERVINWVVNADRQGHRVRFHAVGDGAVRLALDAFEEAQKINGKRDARHTIEHIDIIDPNDIPRFKELGVIASFQPDLIAIVERGVYEKLVGKQRLEYVYPIQTFQESGAQIAFGTDTPIARSLNPLTQIFSAVTRMDCSGVTVWNSNDCISLSEALKAYTIGPAYGSFREHELGTLEVGKLADLTILDRNIFEKPIGELLETKVKMTMVDGRVVSKEMKSSTTGTV
ncbi:amidohydrolase [Bacillus salipaludis]|uniref:Amidohydrolase n=1 Tax=Bacillus salipaludis TaxID=2547811 RepID=A0A4R5VWS8_9BACI|nr:amidohydrolase [Bacillus salipaludis]MDQ6597225.1 amidohydrolase [Bacillus salipaludis]TDK63330.1 amidohydrolase [Bacillus salipaludis]